VTSSADDKWSGNPEELTSSTRNTGFLLKNELFSLFDDLFAGARQTLMAKA
jgi:hypothetical protein